MSQGSPSSQVSLFSTQIAEQILRLRSLSEGGESAAGAISVELKRAIMATRLLAGSARILHLTNLQELLDELLSWLQGIERAQRPLTSSQHLILESVIALEENLMRKLEEDEGAELSGFDEDLDQVVQLVRRDAEGRAAVAETVEDPFEDLVDPPEPEPQEVAAEESPSPPPTPLEASISALELALERLAELPAEDREDPSSLERLRELGRRLREQLGEPETTEGSGATMPEETAPVPSDEARHEFPADDPLLQPVSDLLRAQEDDVGTVHLQTAGSAAVVSEGLHEVVRQILLDLMEDVCAVLRSDRGGGIPRIGIELHRERGRLRVLIRNSLLVDQGPAAHADADHLAFYRGLRRARLLVEQLNGLIEVEPPEAPDQQFTLLLPADLQERSYCLFRLEQGHVAVPWILVDDVISSAGLLFEADSSGESFVRHGHNVPLVELAEFVPSLVPVADPSERIVVMGSVEKRIGLFCEEVGELVDTSRVVDPPAGWESVAYGGVEWEEEIVPLLDVRRLLRLRFGGGEQPDLPGALADPVVDSYVPIEVDSAPETAVEETETEAVEEEAPAPAARVEDLRVVLVNQSEFRRRELARGLEELGHRVRAVATLAQAQEELAHEPADLLVSDLRLGQTAGDNLQTLRRSHADLPIVLTSSVAREHAEELARKAGADACWLDPFRSADLLELLRGLL